MAECGWSVCDAWKTCNCPVKLLGLSIGSMLVSWRSGWLVHSGGRQWPGGLSGLVYHRRGSKLEDKQSMDKQSMENLHDGSTSVLLKDP